MPTGREQLKQFAEDTIEELLHELPTERLLKGLTAEQLLNALSPEKRVELARLINDDNSEDQTPGDAKPEGSN